MLQGNLLNLSGMLAACADRMTSQSKTTPIAKKSILMFAISARIQYSGFK
jgi:hypothetical protein